MSRYMYGMDHPSWPHPVMYSDDPAEVRGLIERTYDPDLGHYLVGPIEEPRSRDAATEHTAIGTDEVNHPHRVQCSCGEWCYDFEAHVQRARDGVDQ